MSPKALFFVVFGTVVEWRSEIIRDLAKHFRRFLCRYSPGAVADAWRAEYQPSMELIRKGNRGVVELDNLHRENLRCMPMNISFPWDRLIVRVG